MMLRAAAHRYCVQVHGYCLMNTHTHLQLTPTTEDGTARAIRQLSIRYVLYFNRRYERVGTLWTGRYLAKPIDDKRYWLSCLRYIEQNPVRAGLVVRPDQYRWSSYRAHAYDEHGDWLATHPILESLGADSAQRKMAYAELFAMHLPIEELVRHQLKA
jgi:REP-associated tyrosine transposase